MISEVVRVIDSCRKSLAWRCVSVLGFMLLPTVAPAQSVEDVLSQDPPFDAEYPASVVELSIVSDGSRMPAHMYLAAGPGPHPTVVLLHGLPGNERNLDIAQSLRRFGFNTLYFHYRGAWGAEGEYRFSQLPEDVLAVLEFLRDQEQTQGLRVDRDALSILGHSLGGYAALASGARDDELLCVIALSPANLGLWQADVNKGGGAASMRLKAYADELFMLEGFTGGRLEEELAFGDASLWDTRGFGAGLQGKSVLMIVGEQDAVTPAATMFEPVVAAYEALGGLDLSAKVITGDHSFSWSRIELTREVLTWSDSHCRASN
ncbi:alpha/beta fold hydrolase [Congregibacter brevis]|uniref:Alpha/beta fold hydrolase n=1 Tax=Congregibacter brevis TaxID=3081201 RepID=A0ABZ0IBT0_9GAMM|nr:alpha/beta fold hydrolase [Congregibacter sp. IMCC45268]